MESEVDKTDWDEAGGDADDTVIGRCQRIASLAPRWSAIARNLWQIHANLLYR